MNKDTLESMFTEEFGHQCNYCARYQYLSGTCDWDNELVIPTEGERCVLFSWDKTAFGMLREEFEMKTQFGMIENPWKKWIMEKTHGKTPVY